MLTTLHLTVEFGVSLKVAILIGTRPEIIKMSPVIRECEDRKIPFILIHSKQHYSDDMDAIFFKELNLPAPHYDLEIGSTSHSNMIGNILIKLEPILEKEKPDVILLQGDTNTVLAGALAGSKLQIKVGHIEAGLRSYDRTMPEEGNRVVTDHLSEYLFAVTDKQVQILNKENIHKNKIFEVGNTVVDALLKNIEISQKSTILNTLNLTAKKYLLFTSHRASNVDKKETLVEIIDILKATSESVCWPIHRRTQKYLNEFNLLLPANVVTTTPLGYLDFLALEKNARMIITDSGGVQEEACILGVPCITIRENTERPETVEVGANILVGRSLEKFKKALEYNFTTWKNPFGDGQTSKKILDIISQDFGLPITTKNSRNEKITVVGMGYMGLPFASLLANAGYIVKGFDVNKEKIDLINSRDIPFQEHGLKEILLSAIDGGNFTASTKIENSNVYIIAVPTPHASQKCDLRYVLAAVESIATVAKDGELLILESTVKPGTCINYIKPLLKKHNLNLDIVHCPERAIPGNTLHELIHNDRIVGGENEPAISKAITIYQSFVKGKIHRTDLTTAESVKLMENTFRDVNIALANELAVISDQLGINVFEAINLANKHPRVNILTPGPGVGGHCIAIDPWFLIEDVKDVKLIKAAREINDERPEHFAKLALKKLENLPWKVGILGVAYKKNVDDTRESPAEALAHFLVKNNVEVMAHDPFVSKWDYKLCSFEELKSWASLLIIVTDHDAFLKLNLKECLVINTRGN